MEQIKDVVVEIVEEQKTEKIDNISSSVLNRVEAHIVTDMISQSCEEVANMREKQVDDLAEMACEKILGLIVGQSIKDQEVESKSKFKEPTPQPTEESECTALKDPLMSYMA